MGRFTADQAENYGGNGGAGYFSLKNDKDVARVRFMYGGIEDVEGIACHEVELDGKKRWVNCLRNYNDPMDACPFCANRNAQYAKLFVPLYNIDEQRVQIWERGKKFFQKIASICSRYSNLVSHTFEIERNGKAGSTQTTYEIYEIGVDNTTLEDLDEVPEIIGTIVLDKSADELKYYLDNGVFPEEDSTPVRRRSASNNDEVPFEEEPARRTPSTRNNTEPARRTPATGRRDKF